MRVVMIVANAGCDPSSAWYSAIDKKPVRKYAGPGSDAQSFGSPPFKNLSSLRHTECLPNNLDIFEIY